MNHPRCDFRVVLRSSRSHAIVALLALACVLLCAVGCRVDDYGNPAYSREKQCTSGVYRGFCEQPAFSMRDAAPDATSDAASDPSTPGAACASEHAEKLCYDGPDRTRAVGACISGVEKCMDGHWTSCFGQVLPKAESCNGKDDDCDGRSDEDAATGNCVSPDTGCAGKLACQNGHTICTSSAEPEPESCNGKDDDCDGDVDEKSDRACADEDNSGCTPDGEDDGRYTCVGECTAGVRRCEDGALSDECTGQVKPEASEKCDSDSAGLDDDCDGMADEGCACQGSAVRPCYAANATARASGMCGAGRQRCSDGTWDECMGAGKPSAESCANQGVDNDCNGRVDDVPGLGKSCVSKEPGRCHKGEQGCVDDELRCVTKSAIDEECNGIDDNCDGETDEPFDLQENEKHCGACDVACEAGEICCNGACADPTDSNDYCGNCITACRTDYGEECCDSACNNFDYDPLNCGACGVTCEVDETCCKETCADLLTDEQNCGSCNEPCDGECVGGQCNPA